MGWALRLNTINTKSLTADAPSSTTNSIIHAAPTYKVPDTITCKLLLILFQLLLPSYVYYIYLILVLGVADSGWGMSLQPKYIYNLAISV